MHGDTTNGQGCLLWINHTHKQQKSNIESKVTPGSSSSLSPNFSANFNAFYQDSKYLKDEENIAKTKKRGITPQLS